MNSPLMPALGFAGLSTSIGTNTRRTWSVCLSTIGLTAAECADVDVVSVESILVPTARLELIDFPRQAPFDALSGLDPNLRNNGNVHALANAGPATSVRASEMRAGARPEILVTPAFARSTSREANPTYRC